MTYLLNAIPPSRGVLTNSSSEKLSKTSLKTTAVQSLPIELAVTSLYRSPQIIFSQQFSKLKWSRFFSAAFF